jgi:hypothetical protein
MYSTEAKSKPRAWDRESSNKKQPFSAVNGEMSLDIPCDANQHVEVTPWRKGQEPQATWHV